MATLTTKFNIGDEVFVLSAGAEMDEAEYGGIELLESILSGVKRLRVVEIILDNSGIKYSATDSWNETKLYQESQLFTSEKEVVFKAINGLKQHLEANLNRTINLIKDLEKDYEGFREKCEE